MNSIQAEIAGKTDELARLCGHYRVRRLELFGSAARDDFDVNTSDLDFLVSFEPLEPSDYANIYFGLLEGLENLFHRPVDLVALSTVKNPYLREGIGRSRMVLYADDALDFTASANSKRFTYDG